MIANGSCEVGEWNKAERLAIAGAIAPSIRSQDESVKGRRIAIKDKNGKTVRYISLAEFQKELLAKRGIELETRDGATPRWKICQRCGFPFRPHNKGGCAQTRCPKCRYGFCEDCKKTLTWSANHAGYKKKREREFSLCRECFSRRRRKSRKTCEICGKELCKNIGLPRFSKPGKPFRCAKHYRTKTKEEQRIIDEKILAERAAGKKLREIGDMFGVGESMASMMIKAARERLESEEQEKDQ